MREPSPPPAADSGETPRADAFALALPLAGIAIRLFVARSSPLPPDDVATFLLYGALQDGAAGLLLALLARGLVRAGVPPWAATAAAAVPFGLLLAGHAGWAEAIVYFGHPPRREDLEVALGGGFLAKSADARSLFRLAAFLSAGTVAAGLGAKVFRRRPRSPRLVLAAAATAAAALASHRLSPIPTANGVLFATLDLALEPRSSDGEGRATVPPPRLPLVAIRELVPERPPGAWLSDANPLAARAPSRSPAAPRLPDGLRPNLVFVLLEGVRAREVSCYGGPVPGLTPHLDRLAREGIRVERAFSPGTYTPQGEAAYWYGLHATPGALLPPRNPGTPLHGLPEILRARGWRSFLWIHNGDQTFYRRDRFYVPRGFRMVDGRDFPRGDVRTNWGFSDKALARRAVDALDQTTEPFAAMVLTVSNHHPFQVPPDATSTAPVAGGEERGYFSPAPGLPLVGRHTVPMMRTIHYTDEAVGDFFRLAAGKEWAKRTLFVVSGDHGLPILPVGGLASPHELAELRHRVPLILWSPLLEGGRVVEGPATLADVPPTLLGLLGLDDLRGFPGVDFLDPGVDLGARPIPLYDEEARRITILEGDLAYHATVEPPRTSAEWALGKELLFDTARDPRGVTDLFPLLPARGRELRRYAEVFLDVYPWLALAGRTALPPEPRPASAGR